MADTSRGSRDRGSRAGYGAEPRLRLRCRKVECGGLRSVAAWFDINSADGAAPSSRTSRTKTNSRTRSSARPHAKACRYIGSYVGGWIGGWIGPPELS
jgi:hypothetical protein